MVLVQKWPFFQLFGGAIQARKICFTILQNEKTPFQAKKTRTSKPGKIEIFPKGLTHALGPKMAIILTFFLGNIGQKNGVLRYCSSTKRLSRLKNKKFKKAKKLRFFQKVKAWFQSKNGYFPSLFFRKMCLTIFYKEKSPFQAIKTTHSKSIGQEKVFNDIRKRKNAFLGYKNTKFKMSKN